MVIVLSARFLLVLLIFNIYTYMHATSSQYDHHQPSVFFVVGGGVFVVSVVVVVVISNIV